MFLKKMILMWQEMAKEHNVRKVTNRAVSTVLALAKEIKTAWEEGGKERADQLEQEKNEQEDMQVVEDSLGLVPPPPQVTR